MRHETLHWRTGKGLDRPFCTDPKATPTLDKVHLSMVALAVAYTLYHVLRFKGWV